MHDTRVEKYATIKVGTLMWFISILKGEGSHGMD